MTPDFKIIAAGANITAQIKERFLGLTISDEDGTKSDSVDIQLDDRDGLIELPRPGALLTVSLGYRETGLMPMGAFTSDEVTISSPPATLSIRAKAADLGGGVKGQKTRSWHDKALTEIVATIAGENKLEPKVSPRYKAIHYAHIDQTAESDLSFLTRLGRDHDALVSVKGGALLFMPRGVAETAGGVPIPPRPIRPSDTVSWTLTLTKREAYKSVIAPWHDRKAAQRREVRAGEGEPALKLRHVYANEAEATQAAKAKHGEVERGSDTLEVVMQGDPTVTAGIHLLAAGFRAGVNGLWAVTSATHDLTASGYTTSARCERPTSGG